MEEDSCAAAALFDSLLAAAVKPGNCMHRTHTHTHTHNTHTHKQTQSVMHICSKPGNYRFGVSCACETNSHWCVCVCACVRERERESVCVCVCVCVTYVRNQRTHIGVAPVLGLVLRQISTDLFVCEFTCVRACVCAHARMQTWACPCPCIAPLATGGPQTRVCRRAVSLVRCALSSEPCATCVRMPTCGCAARAPTRSRDARAGPSRIP